MIEMSEGGGGEEETGGNSGSYSGFLSLVITTAFL